MVYNKRNLNLLKEDIVTGVIINFSLVMHGRMKNKIDWVNLMELLIQPGDMIFSCSAGFL